jgi:hypothetical protein
VRDISKWFEEKSSERDSAGIRKHLDGLVGRLTRTVPGPRQEEPPTGADDVDTTPDPQHPDEPVNSL